MSIPAPRRPMTPDERTAASALRKISTYPGFERRFCQTLAHWADTTGTITDKSAPILWRLFHKFRRQIACQDKERLLALAADRKQQDPKMAGEWRRQQEEINRLKAQYAEQMAQKKQDEPQPEEDLCQMKLFQ